MSNKITKKDRYFALLAMDAVKADVDMTNFILHEIELLDRKNSAERKPSKEQVANEGYMQEILAFLGTCDEPQGIGKIAKGIPSRTAEGEPFSPQKVSALMKTLGDKVVKTTVKGKVFFSLAE